MLIVTVVLGLYFNGYQDRFSPSILKMDNAVNTHTSKSRADCHSPYRNSDKLPSDKCIFNAGSSNKINIFIFGDSHANHMVPFINTLAIDANMAGQDYTLDRCLPIFDLKWGSNLHLANKCEARNQLSAEYIKQNSFDYILMAASWPGANTRRIFAPERLVDDQKIKQVLQQKLDKTIQGIIASGAIPVIIEDIPTLEGKHPKCPIKQRLFNADLNCDIKYTTNILFLDLINSLKKKHTQLIVVSPHKTMCNNDNCTMILSDIPLYRDEDHLNEIGSTILADLFLQKNKKPFKNKIVVSDIKQLKPIE